MGLTFPGTGAQIERVWLNGATAAMGQQTISMDLSPYRMVLVVYRDLSASYELYQTSVIVVDGANYMLVMVGVDSKANYIRNIVARTTGLTVGDCYGPSGGTYNQVAVPVAVYGIQF